MSVLLLIIAALYLILTRNSKWELRYPSFEANAAHARKVEDGKQHLYLGKLEVNGVPEPYFEELEAVRSVTVVGSSGSGKTAWLMAYCAQAAARGEATFFGDLKASGSEVPRHQEQLARKHGRPFYYFSPEAGDYSHALNFIAQTQRTTRDLAKASHVITTALRSGSDLPHTFYSGRSKSALAHVAVAAPEADTPERIVDYLESPECDLGGSSDVVGLADALRQYASIPALNVSTFDSAAADSVKQWDFEEMIRSGAQCYFRLEELHDLAWPILTCLLEAQKRVNAGKPLTERFHTTAVIDEYAAIAGHKDLAMRIRETGRDAQLRICLTVQGLNQTDQISRGLSQQLLDGPVLYFGSGDTATKQYLLDEFQNEVWLFDEFGDATSYRTEPGLRHKDLDGLLRNKGMFLARFPERGLAYLSTQYCMSESEYETLRGAGFFESGLEGGILNECFDFRNPRTKPHTPIEPNSKLAAALSAAAKSTTTQKGDSDGSRRDRKVSKRSEGGKRKGGGKREDAA